MQEVHFMYIKSCLKSNTCVALFKPLVKPSDG